VAGGAGGPAPREDWFIWVERGREHLRAGRRGPATEAFARAVALGPDELYLCYQAAPLLAAAGDTADYERLRAEMLRRWGDTADAQTAERVAKAYLLRPADGDGLRRAVALAGRAERAVRDKRAGGLAPYFELAAGLAEYRRGAFADAERRLERLLASDRPPWNAAAPGGLVLAMARQRLGKPGPAQEALRRAAALLASGVPDAAKDPAGDVWLDVFIAEVLRREAEALVLGQATAGGQ
jgi:tetratricopeptide (TPR) repeat protein